MFIVTLHYERSILKGMNPSSKITIGRGGTADIPAAMPNLDGVTHHTVAVPGVRLHVAEAGARTGTPVLLLHGFPQHWWQWRDVIRPLAEKYRVICPDLRGAGWSDAPRRGYTRDQLLADVIALMDELRLPRVHIVAHDWSAIIAFELALRHPDRVERLVVLGVPPPFTRVDWRFLPLMRFLWFQPVVATGVLGPLLLGRGRQPLARHLLKGILARPPGFDTEVQRFLGPLRDPAHARAGSALYRQCILPTAGLISRGAYLGQHLTTPTLALFGLADRAMRPELIGTYDDNADDLTVEFVPDAGHFIADDVPADLVRRVDNFFTRA
jgi:pimeloyl-ACP methyl ester carboxylesterase